MKRSGILIIGAVPDCAQRAVGTDNSDLELDTRAMGSLCRPPRFLSAKPITGKELRGQAAIEVPTELDNDTGSSTRNPRQEPPTDATLRDGTTWSGMAPVADCGVTLGSWIHFPSHDSSEQQPPDDCPSFPHRWIEATPSIFVAGDCERRTLRNLSELVFQRCSRRYFHDWPCLHWEVGDCPYTDDHQVHHRVQTAADRLRDWRAASFLQMI
jgi:hypothetical protein